MNVRQPIQIISLLVVIALGSAIAACASGQREGGRGRMQGPPPEAIEACSGKSEGDGVTFDGPRGESLSGTCQMVDDQLVAVPEGHASRHQ